MDRIKIKAVVTVLILLSTLGIFTYRKYQSKKTTSLIGSGLLIKINSEQEKALLEDWNWLFLNEPYKIFAVTAFGNLFLLDNKEQVFFLDTGLGVLGPLGIDKNHYDEFLSDSRNRKSFLLEDLFQELQKKGMKLDSESCYSFKVPPLIGGKAEVSNMEVTSLVVHSSILTQLSQKVYQLEEESHTEE